MTLLLTGLLACGGGETTGPGTDTPDDASLDGSGAGDTSLDAGGDDVPSADIDAGATDTEGEDTDDGANPSDTDTDPGTDADVDTGLPDTSPDDVDAIADVDADADVDRPDTTPDAGTDAAPDASDGTSDAGRDLTPGALPLADWIPCNQSIDCPNGAGNCITSLALNRTLPDGRGSLPMTEVFPDLGAAGVCSLACTTSDELCEGLGFRADPAPWTCQLVFAGDPAYRDADGSGAPLGLPLPVLPDDAEMTAGVPWAALCRPPFDRSTSYSPDFCLPCSDSLTCLGGSACLLDRPNASTPSEDGSCVVPCADDSGCPTGFSCRAPSDEEAVSSGDPAGLYCMPDLGTCGACLDSDGDRRGLGACAPGFRASSEDCDDTSDIAYYDAVTPDHAFPDVCAPDADVNCNGLPDDSEQVGTAEWGEFHCTACNDPCTGSYPNASEVACLAVAGASSCEAICTDPTAFADCNGEYEDGCETSITDPSRLFVPDCDGDGVGAAVAAPTFACAESATFTIAVVRDGVSVECEAVRAVERTDGTWGADCDDSAPTTFPGAEERCDTIDNDCNGVADPPELLGLGNTCSPGDGVFGTCALGAVNACGPSGDVICVPAAPQEEVCDGADNDCDELVDDFPTPNALNRIGEPCTAVGAAGTCAQGGLQCRSGSLTCVASAPAATDAPGDAIDSDCDGFDGDLDRAIFVRLGGAVADSPTLGTRANPVGTLIGASRLLWRRVGTAVPVTQIYLAEGNYTMPHAIEVNSTIPALTIVGGYNVDLATNTWTASSSQTSQIEFSSICGCDPVASRTSGACVPAACVSPQAAISARGFTSLTLRQLNITVPTQPVGFGTVVGLRCERTGGVGCDAVQLDSVNLVLEAGAPGSSAATDAAAGSAGVDGTIGLFAFSFWGVAGPSSCGAAGGNGGTIISGTCFVGTGPSRVLVDRAFLGFSGSAGAPSVGGGVGGAAGSFIGDNCEQISSPSNGTRGLSGRTAGAAGSAGASAAPLRVTAGGTGGGGQAGGGGGGGGTRPGVFYNTINIDPILGGGGASGGCGGAPGSGGGPGGTVIGMWLEDQVTGPRMTDVVLRVGPGGTGGNGQNAGDGGAGGSRGSQLAGGSFGGAGGHGAGGGGGGGGAGGWSIGVARYPGIAFPITPSVGTGGVGGRGGSGGAGVSTPITPVPGATPVSDASVRGATGADGAAGSAGLFCNLSATVIAGEPSCR